MKENTAKKATCCHKCGRVHVKGTTCKRPYLTGKDSCAVNEVQDLKEFFSKPSEETQLEAVKRPVKELKNKKPGLWANINAKRARGEKPSHGNSKAFKDAVKAGKKINKTKK